MTKGKNGFSCTNELILRFNEALLQSFLFPRPCSVFANANCNVNLTSLTRRVQEFVVASKKIKIKYQQFSLLYFHDKHKKIFPHGESL